jgi:hypothetical protein
MLTESAMPYRLRFTAASLVAFLLLPQAAAAHEFWMMARPFSPAVGAPTALSLYVGEFFSGELLPIAASQAAAIHLYSKTAPTDLGAQLPPDQALPALKLSLPAPGTYMLAYDSNPTQISLSADKFHAYLHEEGLDAIIRQRESDGNAEQPGRERYRRHVKTLLRVGGKSDGTYSVLTGQRLEIVPTSDPLARSAGDKLTFTLFFDSKPLAGALVKAWHKQDEQTLSIRARTGADGKVIFNLPYAGVWMISVVHMLPVTDTPDIDWDSFWGNLTFELAGKRQGR